MSKAKLGRQMARRLAMLAQGAPSLLLVALLLALGLSAGRWGSAAAQDATPAMATPTAECMPAVGDGDMGGMDMGATPAASPVAEPVGAEADAETAAAVAAAAENAVACYNNGEVDAFLGLVTDNFIVNVFGNASRDEAAADMSAEGPEGILPLEGFAADADSALTYDDGRASVEVAYTQFGTQFVEATWYFVISGSDYLLDDEEFLSPEPDVDFVTIISARVDADPFRLDQSTSTPATDAIVIQLINNSEETHEFAVVRLPEGTALNEDGTLPEGMDMAAIEGMFESGELMIVAYAEVDAAGIQDIAVLGLAPGLYALVDITGGTVVPLTITEPAA